MGGRLGQQLHLGPQVTSALGIPEVAATRFETACASSHAAFRHALFEEGRDIADARVIAEIAARHDLRPPDGDDDASVTKDWGEGRARGVIRPEARRRIFWLTASYPTLRGSSRAECWIRG